MFMQFLDANLFVCGNLNPHPNHDQVNCRKLPPAMSNNCLFTLIMFTLRKHNILINIKTFLFTLQTQFLMQGQRPSTKLVSSLSMTSCSHQNQSTDDTVDEVPDSTVDETTFSFSRQGHWVATFRRR